MISQVMMNNIIYIKALFILFGIVSSIFLFLFILKKAKLDERLKFKNKHNRIEIFETKRIDNNKKVTLIKIDGNEYICILSDNYGMLLNGGESRIRTYERARRADLQSAAFGHSAISP